MRSTVDVLAVMERDAELALNWNGRAKGSSMVAYGESKEARAAVAELIEAVGQLIELDDCEAPCDPACIYCRTRAALARVQGGAK